jgi:hypothetical protein
MPQNCTVSRSDSTFRVEVTVVSDYFSPIMGDFVLTFKKPTTSGLLPTDLNEDGIVNMLDLTIVAAAFGSRPGGKNWNVAADFDGNGRINIIDVVVVAKDFGRTA